MIARISGEVVAIGATFVVVDVNGIGVRALCGPNTTADLHLGQRATLATSLVVREDSLTLFGFATEAERECFELLQTATGVGPKLAQAALAVLTPDDLREAIVTENLVALIRVPGVGRKGAQRIVIELKDKINALAPSRPVLSSPAATPSPAANWRDQVSQGLQGLGWSARDADAACDRVADQADDPDVSVAVLMRAALQSLAK